MAVPRAIPGSFRDPGGHVYRAGQRIFRTVMPSAAADFDFMRESGLSAKLIDKGWLISHTMVDPDELGAAAVGASYVLEHPRLPFVSYPYEWPFAALKAAALLQLDLLLETLPAGATLVDASAYNIQFLGPEPVFIDTLSFRRYVEGSYWLGHRQFCEQFLNPLLLRSHLGIGHHDWYRGSLEGIAVGDIDRLMPWWRMLSPNVLMHVKLQARLQRRSGARKAATETFRKQNLSASAFANILRGLRRWIEALQPAVRRKSVFEDYARDNTYSSDDTELKSQFVAEFVASAKPRVVLDMGCNTGHFAAVVLAAGADHVVGLDTDTGALDQAYANARRKKMKLLPLHMNLSDPSPDRGWNQVERSGLSRRCAESCDAILALALVHHLAIAGNVPLTQVVRWLISLAPRGVIEFVPKSDPMVQQLLSLREDIFPDYSEAAFVHALEEEAVIVRQAMIPGTKRQLYAFERKPGFVADALS